MVKNGTESEANEQAATTTSDETDKAAAAATAVTNEPGCNIQT